MHVTDSADIGSKGTERISNSTERISNSSMSGIGSSTRAQPSSESPKHGQQGSIVHGNFLDQVSRSRSMNYSK